MKLHGRLVALCNAVLVGVAVTLPKHAGADTSRSEVSLRASLLHASSPVTDTMVGAGIGWRYHVADDWYVAFTLDSYDYDIQYPFATASQRSTSSGVASFLPSRTIAFSTALGKRRQDAERRFDWFWQAGIGVGITSISVTTTAATSASEFDLDAETGAAIHLGVSAGATYHLSPDWAFVAAGRVEHQFVDIRITDRSNGATTTIDRLSPVGLSLSLSYRF